MMKYDYIFFFPLFSACNAYYRTLRPLLFFLGEWGLLLVHKITHYFDNKTRKLKGF